MLEHLGGGDLFDFLKKRDFKLSQADNAKIIYKIANAIFYLHRLSIVHRDIKLENIMMSTDDLETTEPKLIDFGLAKSIGPDQKISDKFGTLGYCAPEILRRESYDKSVDLFSFGVTIFAIVSGHFPFSGQTN